MRVTQKNIGDLVNVKKHVRLTRHSCCFNNKIPDNDLVLGVNQIGIVVNIGFYDSIERVIIDDDVDYTHIRSYTDGCNENEKGFITVLLKNRLLNLTSSNEFSFITFELKNVKN